LLLYGLSKEFLSLQKIHAACDCFLLANGFVRRKKRQLKKRQRYRSLIIAMVTPNVLIGGKMHHFLNTNTIHGINKELRGYYGSGKNARIERCDTVPCNNNGAKKTRSYSTNTITAK